MNIKEILKYAPVGTKLYCPIYGEVEFDGMKEIENSTKLYSPCKSRITVKTEAGKFMFDDNGKWYEHGECLLFPSSDDKSWEHWQYYLLKENDIVHVETIDKNTCGTYCIVECFFETCTVVDCKHNEMTISYDVCRYATDIEKFKFVRDLKENGWHYDLTNRTLTEDKIIDAKDAARITFTYEDISGQRTLIKPFEGYEAKIEDGNVIISKKKKEPFLKAGESYVVIKDVNVSLENANGKFVKGNIYKCKEDNTITNEYCGMFIDGHDGKANKYFVHINIM